MIKLWILMYITVLRGSDTIYDVPNAKTTSYGRIWMLFRSIPLGQVPGVLPIIIRILFGGRRLFMASAAGIDPLGSVSGI
jgi:hypothetical protein